MKSKDLENKLEEIIDNSYQEEKKAVYDNLKKVFDFLDDGCGAPAQRQVARKQVVSKQPTQRTASKWRNNFKNFFKKPARVAACISMAVAVACLAIILPFTLSSNSLWTAPQEERFCEAGSCQENKLDHSLKEYSKRNNLSLLYVDWYDIADVVTLLHVNKQDRSDIIYFQETLIHRGTGSIVELYINHYRTRVDIVENYLRTCIFTYKSTKNHGLTVRWGYETAENGERYTYVAQFLFRGYDYTIVLRYPMDDNDIFELIDSVLAGAIKTL